MKSSKIAVYTTIIGPYDGLLPQPKFDNVDYICFTDQSFRSKTWKFVPLKVNQYSPARTSRLPKINPHQYLKDYDYSIHIDGNILVLKNPRILLEKVLEHAPMGIYDHNQASDPRNCVYDEHQAIINLYNRTGVLKDSLDVMAKQMRLYREEKYPEKNGLISAGVILRAHHNPEVVKTMEKWWDEFCKGSKRDQLSFNYAAWKNNFKPYIIAGDVRDNAYFHMIGQHRKNYSKKYFRYRLKEFLGIIKHPKK